jgi:histidinol-phosphate/aromatic aminotransferase/cobyric acid decarboxylase-like protein
VAPKRGNHTAHCEGNVSQFSSSLLKGIISKFFSVPPKAANLFSFISCSSGTDALLMALMAQGVGPGDAIFTSPFTFIATAEVIQLLGATPVFVDIDPTEKA